MELVALRRVGAAFSGARAGLVPSAERGRGCRSATTSTRKKVGCAPFARQGAGFLSRCGRFQTLTMIYED
jgi:hypothetical protein